MRAAGAIAITIMLALLGACVGDDPGTNAAVDGGGVGSDGGSSGADGGSSSGGNGRCIFGTSKFGDCKFGP